MSQEFGVHSEVGRLRKVLVCAPGRAHQRLTPSNNDDLLFDDDPLVSESERRRSASLGPFAYVRSVEVHPLPEGGDGVVGDLLERDPPLAQRRPGGFSAA